MCTGLLTAATAGTSTAVPSPVGDYIVVLKDSVADPGPVASDARRRFVVPAVPIGDITKVG
jgi:hypothetical protein